MAPGRASGARARLRFRHSGPRAGHTLWRLRYGAECGLGQRRDGSQHGGVRRGEYSPLVAVDGAERIPAGQDLADHGGWRGEEWVARASVETGTPAVRG